MPHEDVTVGNGNVLIGWHLFPQVVAQDEERQKGIREMSQVCISFLQQSHTWECWLET